MLRFPQMYVTESAKQEGGGRNSPTQLSDGEIEFVLVLLKMAKRVNYLGEKFPKNKSYAVKNATRRLAGGALIFGG